MSVFLGFYGLYDLYYNSDSKLDDLECSEWQKIVFYSAFKTILFLLYFIDQTLVPTAISNETMLFYGMCGYGLISGWLPVLKAYQFVSLFLMCLQTLFLVIGALHTIKMALLYANVLPAYLFTNFRYTFGNFFYIILIRLIGTLINNNYSGFHQFMTNFLFPVTPQETVNLHASICIHVSFATLFEPYVEATGGFPEINL